MNYSLGATRASLPFSELARIKIPMPTANEVELIASIEIKKQEAIKLQKEAESKINKIAEDYIKYLS